MYFGVLAAEQLGGFGQRGRLPVPRKHHGAPADSGEAVLAAHHGACRCQSRALIGSLATDAGSDSARVRAAALAGARQEEVDGEAGLQLRLRATQVHSSGSHGQI